jgi:hypothetical protein
MASAKTSESKADAQTKTAEAAGKKIDGPVCSPGPRACVVCVARLPLVAFRLRPSASIWVLPIRASAFGRTTL